MTKLFTTTSETEVHTETSDSGLVDAKGRSIGYRITVKEMIWVETDEMGYSEARATKFWATTTTTRNGNGFGAYVRPVRGNTFADVIKLAHKRRDDSFKRAAKNNAKS